ncbi:MAG: transposase [Gemmatimonadetes bacterium]|nr:transposase [Gemmatimonadota bacterium]
MLHMGITAICPQPGTSRRHRAHPVYPYLLRHRTITRPNAVWAMDITYIPMAHGFVYLAAVLDWATRRVLSWRVSITLDSAFCIAAVEDALGTYGCPEIFNTDQGAQFTSTAFTGLLLDYGIRISMDGKGCWRDTVFVERLWRSRKYEEVYLHAYDSVSAAIAGIGRYLTLYNTRRPHSSLDDRTPDEAYFTPRPLAAAA